MDRPLPPKPHDIETNADARRRYKTEARDIYVGNLGNRGRRLAVSTTLSIARRFIGQDIYFPVKLDFRGRMYAVPQFLSPQGPDFARGMLEFARGEKLGRSGLKWLKIHTANTFGVDKVSMEERIAWVDENIDQIKRVAADPLAETWWHEADAPIQFLSACLDLAAAVSSPDPTQYVSHLPIMVDGSCNGIQHLDAAAPKPNMLNGIRIGKGSIVKVAFEVNPFGAMPASKVAGVSLRLSAVQVIKHVPPGIRDASAFGFGAEEGGFTTADAAESSAPFDPNSEPDVGGGVADDADF